MLRLPRASRSRPFPLFFTLLLYYTPTRVSSLSLQSRLISVHFYAHAPHFPLTRLESLKHSADLPIRIVPSSSDSSSCVCAVVPCLETAPLLHILFLSAAVPLVEFVAWEGFTVTTCQFTFS